MDLVFLLADMDRNTGEALRAEVQDFAALRDFTYRLFAVSLPEAWEKIPPEDWSMMSLAFVSLEFPDARRLGERIYAANPFCRLIYLGKGQRSVIPVLSSRPVRYLDTTAGIEVLRRCLREEYESLLREKGRFVYEDRYQLLCLPFSGIRYFVSRDRAVYCTTDWGERGPLRRTLDQVEKELESGVFLRCHKSYLVRRNICVALDKSARELVLKDGTRLPVSRSCWEAVAEELMSKC